ncbi:hypothetical protein ACQEU5_09690 [Marinactinospora thermotolerans]|uniref:Uncharacterized protein n=1 Tax=Marinactinospora thermotolerans DSM 45154 TaxID=1122192 RepID=A0A1T4NAX3_9ACTN|nr:hypothetical protein [Marinactinospora thermotolerans]SJZ76226.1 hypothetical protein SAMN02745673_01359 [Marinactinospora thermotolerans DSM 45154]
MLALLRSRRALFVLAGLVIVGMVGAMALRLFSVSAPAPPSGEASLPDSAPALSTLGAAPDGIEYTDLGEQCDQRECFRPVAITAEEGDGTEAIDTVYTHLLDQGWGRLLPEGASDPDEVAFADSALTNGSVIVQGSAEPYTEDSTAGLLIAHATEPSASPSSAP